MTKHKVTVVDKSGRYPVLMTLGRGQHPSLRPSRWTNAELRQLRSERGVGKPPSKIYEGKVGSR